MPEVPTWKDHFPISWVDDHFVTRREFTKSLVWVSLATFLANVVLAGPPSRPLPRVTLERRGEELWAIGKAS